MFRYKTKRKALIIASLVILLCLVSLTGATLALFTNDINDGTIGIVTTSGTVDVDIVDLSGETLQNKALEFITTSDQGKTLFEPGATFYTQEFKVINKGNIPVNFSLSVSKDDKIDMKEFDEAFEVWIVKASEKNIINAERVTNFKGYLVAAESSESYCLFIKMKENVGNDFQGKLYTGIGVTVYAVQGNVSIGE